MPAQIKTDYERARLDSIFAEVEAMERGEFNIATTEPHTEPQPLKSKTELRLEGRPLNEIVGDAKSNLKNQGCHTMWERIYAKALVELYEEGFKAYKKEQKEIGPLNEELNILRNFVTAVKTRLEKCEKTAREQDNHHYYKIFAEGVNELLEHL